MRKSDRFGPRMRPSVLALLAALVVASNAAAAGPCLNKFLSRSEGPRKILTLLTGKITYQEAQKLAAAIGAKEAPPLEWIDDNGKNIAKQYGELKVVRPMPVGCDEKQSGVVMVATFATVQKPGKVLRVKFDESTTIAFEQQ